MIFQSIVQEALMITAFGTTLGMFGGVAIVLGFSRVIVARIGIPFYWPSAYWLASILLATLGVALITGALAALYPALEISREDPRRALFEDTW
jgi:ABC-type antimicrobial peptide transport system permease subunit